VKFTKMHGLGNDFILINCIDQLVSRPGMLAKELCNRHLGGGGRWSFACLCKHLC